MGFPGGLGGKESVCNVGDLGWEDPLEHGYPLQYSCLEYPHGQRSLVGCSPWGCKESGTTEHLSTAQHIHFRMRVWSLQPWTISHQAPLSMGFPRQEYWSVLPFPSPGDLPDPEIKPTSRVSPALAGAFFTAEPPEKPQR